MPALCNSEELLCTRWTTPVSSTISLLWRNPMCFSNLPRMSSIQRVGQEVPLPTNLGTPIQVTTAYCLLSARIATCIITSSQVNQNPVQARTPLSTPPHL